MEQTTEAVSEQSLEKSVEELGKIAEFRHTQFIGLIKAYKNFFYNEMMRENGNTYNNKIQAKNALDEIDAFVLDFGLGITNSNLRQTGKLSKEINALAAVLVQALDNRFILLANNMKKQQDAEAASETKENENV